MHASPETTDDEVMNYCTAIDLKNEEGRRQFATGKSPETSSSPTTMPFFVAMEAMIFIFCLLLFATHVFSLQRRRSSSGFLSSEIDAP